MPTDQTSLERHHLALAHTTVPQFVELCQSLPLMTGALHLPRTGAAQATKEDDHINTEHESFACFFSYCHFWFGYFF